MDESTLLLEYLKEQYTQARQHENRATSATTFLTGAAAVVLGVAFKDGGAPQAKAYLPGLILVFLAGANIVILRMHFLGNRFHTSLAGATRRALEASIGEWTVDKPTALRTKVLKTYDLQGPDHSIGGLVHKAMMIIPLLVAMLGLALIGYSLAAR